MHIYTVSPSEQLPPITSREVLTIYEGIQFARACEIYAWYLVCRTRAIYDRNILRDGTRISLASDFLAHIVGSHSDVTTQTSLDGLVFLRHLANEEGLCTHRRISQVSSASFPCCKLTQLALSRCAGERARGTAIYYAHYVSNVCLGDTHIPFRLRLMSSVKRWPR